jgi:hypothetical protein
MLLPQNSRSLSSPYAMSCQARVAGSPYSEKADALNAHRVPRKPRTEHARSASPSVWDYRR